MDLGSPWPTVAVHQAVSDACARHIDLDTGADSLRRMAAANHVPAPDGMSAGDLVVHLYDHLVEPVTVAPKALRWLSSTVPGFHP